MQAPAAPATSCYLAAGLLCVDQQVAAAAVVVWGTVRSLLYLPLSHTFHWYISDVFRQTAARSLPTRVLSTAATHRHQCYDMQQRGARHRILIQLTHSALEPTPMPRPCKCCQVVLLPMLGGAECFLPL